jgi:hypothetical protein
MKKAFHDYPRDEQIKGLKAIIAFLEANPEFDMPEGMGECLVRTLVHENRGRLKDKPRLRGFGSETQMNVTETNGRKAHKPERLTFDEKSAAVKIGVSYRQLIRYRAQGLISFYRVGARILYDDQCLQEFLAERRQAAA